MKAASNLRSTKSNKADKRKLDDEEDESKDEDEEDDIANEADVFDS